MNRPAQGWFALLRRLARRPGFALAVLSTLALGVGANTVTFDLLYGYLLAPLPYAHSGQLANLYFTAPSMPGNLGMSYRTYFDLRQSLTAVTDSGMLMPASFNLTSSQQAAHVEGAAISASLLSTLGVRPLLGRPFGPEANKPGASPQLLISERLWSRLFGRDPAVTGKSVRLDGTSYLVTGVMPEGFQLLSPYEDVWVAKIVEPEEAQNIADPGSTLIVRLKPGTSLSQLTAQAQSVLDREIAHYPDPSLIPLFKKLRLGMAATTLRHLLLGDLGEHLVLAQLATGLLLLLIWFNLANLFIARAQLVRCELVLRRVLGAQTPVLFRELLSESLTLSLAGSAAGFLLGELGVRALLHAGLLNAALPPAEDAVIVAGLALLLALLSALLFALAGLHFIRRQDLAQALKDMEVRSAGPGERRIRAALVITQLTIACLLSAIGAMLAHSLIKLGTLQLGFTPGQLVTLKIETPAGAQDRAALLPQFGELRRALSAVPGVTAATIASSLPFDGNPHSNALFPYPFDGTHTPSVLAIAADAGYFRTLGQPLRQGRLPQAGSPDGLPEAVVDVRAAQDLFGTPDAVGRVFTFNRPGESSPNMRFRVSGVAGATRRSYSAAGDATGSVYIGLANRFFFNTWYVAVRTALPPQLILPGLTQALQRTLPGTPVYDVRTMDQRLSQQLAPRRGLVTLVLVFAASSLLVAAMGLYAVASYTVSQRRPELGIRAALGADPARLRRLVLQETARQLAIGMPLGLAGAVVLGRALAESLYGVQSADGLSLSLVSGVLAGAALIAGWVPAWRASRVSPLEALRDR